MPYPKIKSESYTNVGGINTKVSSYVLNENEVLDIRNMNFVAPGALSKRPGSTLYVGATVSGRITGLYEFEKLSGASYIIAAANTNMYSVAGSFSAIRTSLLNNALFDFVTFVDRLFTCNGQDFFKYDGSGTSRYSLPQGQSIAGYGITAAIGGGLSGTFVASYGYINDRGYRGPCSDGITLSLNGITFGSVLYFGLSVPADYGVSAYAFYRSAPGQINMYGTTTQSVAIGATYVDNAAIGTIACNDNRWFTLAPKMLEIYNNQLFMAGFSSALSEVDWSYIGEPEGVAPEFNAEIRTNDGDKISALKSYGAQLIITKERSFHRLLGENPSNFTIQEISDQYGCLSNRAIVTYQDYIAFLDSKGIIRFNGANIDVISNRVEPFFKNMNINAARDNAIALHNRIFNEIWFSIPCNGATLNNCTIIYDYLSDAFTVYEGIDISSMTIAKGNREIKSPLFGNYSGSIHYFSASLMGDNGRAITCLIQTRFHAPQGQTTEQQFRRFFLNVNPVGVTQGIATEFLNDYGSSVYFSATMYQAPFQSRIEMGVPARSLSAKISHNSETLDFKVFGWTIEARYQRSV